MKKFFKWIRRDKRGQTATEYMLILAAVVLALVAVASKFITPFQQGVQQLGQNVQAWLGTNQTMTGAGD